MADNANVLDFFTLFGPHPTHSAASETGAKRLRDALARHGIPTAVTLSTRAVYFDAIDGNRETQQEVGAAEGALIPAALLDPCRPNPERTGGGARVLALLPASQRYPLPYQPLTEMLRTLAHLGGAAAASIPVWWETARPGDATALLATVRETEYPAPIVLGGVTGASLLEAIAVAKAVPDRLHVATDGLRGIGEVAFAVESLGAERVVFASGAAGNSLAAALAVVRQAGLADDALAQVLGGNGRRLLGARNGA